MAQLVKLQDYISRYQVDLARYPSQFVRLKKGQWMRVKQEWEKGDDFNQSWIHFDENQEVSERGRFKFIKKLFSKKRQEEAEESSFGDGRVEELENVEIQEDETMLDFEANILYKPQSILDLKRMYLDQFFHFQMKWASSTLRERSYVDPKYMRDTLLRAFLQTLPDNYLVFYYPILKLKNAPIELDIVVLTPTECIAITLLEDEDQAVFVADGERFWTKKVGKEQRRRLNPSIQLNRMESILKQLFSQQEVEMPIRKVLLSRNGFIDFPGNTYNMQIVDKRNFPQWMEQLRNSPSPMKHMQIRAAQCILQVAQTTSFARDIWQVDEQQSEEER